jgi:hypothetical protein
MTKQGSSFFDAYINLAPPRIFTLDKFPDLDSTQINQFLLPGSLERADYKAVELEFRVHLPQSFIGWHRQYYFLDCDCSILRLPISDPRFPLKDLRQRFDGYIGEQLIPKHIYPFAEEGNDLGPLVFDGRQEVAGNNFPIRAYDHEFGGDLAGLTGIIFSSFDKLLECTTYFLKELKFRKDFEIIPDFFSIDPAGAGLTGVKYWSGCASMLQAK